MRRGTITLLALLLALLTACGGQGDGQEEQPPYHLTVRVSEAQPTLDPARVTARGGEAVLFHLYENLMRWEDDGKGWAIVGYGQAEDYAVETDYAGNSTYTFTLREDIVWSDGAAVTSEDFAAAWRRLADPANDLPHRTLLEAVSGYQEVQETGDASLLGVSAPDARTFVVSLQGSPSYFLEELCASAYTMPVRAGEAGGVTNGPYTAAASGEEITLTRSETYYAANPQGPETIRFIPLSDRQADYDALQAGEADLVVDLPEEPLEALVDSGLWTPEPVARTYGVLLNTRRTPFDDPNVRLAFHLAVDRQALAEALGDPALRPAPGVVPYGVADYSKRPVEEEEEEPVLPDPNAAPAPEEPAPTCWDFRSHSLHLVTAEHTHDYEADRNYAQALLAQAGYAGGSGFPAVEYLYVDGPAFNRALAEALRDMWKECLGVTVAIRGVSEEAYREALLPVQPEESGEEDAEEGGEAQESAGESEDGAVPVPAFTMAAQAFVPPYSDAGALLESWYSESPANAAGYASEAFDILIASARAAVSPDARDAYLHDAEAILLQDSPVIPLLCQGGSYALREGLTGLYRRPNGVYFLQDVTPEGKAS